MSLLSDDLSATPPPGGPSPPFSLSSSSASFPISPTQQDSLFSVLTASGSQSPEQPSSPHTPLQQDLSPVDNLRHQPLPRIDIELSDEVLHNHLASIQQSLQPQERSQNHPAHDRSDLCNQSADMPSKTSATIAILTTLISYVSINSLVRHFHPNTFVWVDEDREDRQWISTSKSWLDRKACRWLGLCGTAHFQLIGSEINTHRTRHGQTSMPDGEDDDRSWEDAWRDPNARPEDWDKDDRVLREIPEYVLEYAPLVHLYSGEQFWPCDIAEHLYHVTPKVNYTPVEKDWQNPNLTNLDGLNQWQKGRFVFLTSNDNVEDRPNWLGGEKNIPQLVPGDDDNLDDEPWAEWDGRIDGELPADIEDGRKGWEEAGQGGYRKLGGDRPDPPGEDNYKPGETPEGEEMVNDRRISRFGKRTRGGRSDAPAVLIVVDKGHGVVDAFWFYFYSFNLGNVVLNVRFGNHVGDWEHSMVRFKNGVPKAVYFSEHNFGTAFSYEAVEKYGKRPVIYSAVGTHAMYATPGTHAYVLPWGLLHDVTDRGPLWDPALNSHAYTYDYITDDLRASNLTPHAPTNWFYFAGHWGDKYYPLSDRRQYRFAGQYHYVNGPLGPRFKDLGRRRVCGGNKCTVQNFIEYERLRPKRWPQPDTEGDPGDAARDREEWRRFEGDEDSMR